MSLADIKRQARTDLHARMAVPASYSLDGTTVPSPAQISAGLVLTVRWHNKLARNGALDGDFQGEIIEGIDRLVFNQDQLDALGLTLVRGGVVSIPDYDQYWTLDSQEPSDGPLNRYWVIAAADGSS